jgi:hypothetical protein
VIARVARFDSLTDDQRLAQKDNLRLRFKAAISEQLGFVAAFWLEKGDDVISVSVWQSEETMQLAGGRANAVPLLPDQKGEDIPSPSTVETWSVFDHLVAPSQASAGAES